MKRLVLLMACLVPCLTLADSKDRGDGGRGRERGRDEKQELRRLSNDVETLIIQNESLLSPAQRQDVAQRLRDIRSILKGEGTNAPVVPLPPKSSGQYCTAACTNSNGVADLRYMAGALGQFEAEAKQEARDAVTAEFSCRYSAAIVECSNVHLENSYTAVSACVSSDGNPDLRYTAKGKASSRSEAKLKARIATQSEYNCRYAIGDVISSLGDLPTYCTAACINSSGAADTNYSKGASGIGEADATLNSIKAVNAAYSCRYGIKVTECSSK